MPTPYIVNRQAEIERILEALGGSHCVSLVGMSNTGKSTILRSLSDAEFAARYQALVGRRAAFVYVDCNAMLELSGQGFYELVLRSVNDSLSDLADDLQASLNDYYQHIVEPDTQFHVPLSFNHAMTTLIEDDKRDLILLFDEFDEAFDSLDGRVFLNLRALKDRYQENLVYITATSRMLGARRNDEPTAEFFELMAPHTYRLKPLTRAESDELAKVLATSAGLPSGLTKDELNFLWREAGGHPRLLRASVSHLVEMDLSHPEDAASQTEEAMHLELQDDVTIQAECTRLWTQFEPERREALIQLARGHADHIEPRMTHRLLNWGLAYEEEDGTLRLFSDLMANFVLRQASVHHDTANGIRVDSDSGEVWVDGKPIATLTELEFKLLSLLHDRENKLTDKYQIVETVWGVDYIDAVDDSRIEKLVSRLRAKVELDSSDPRHIITIRGRGYKLVRPD